MSRNPPVFILGCLRSGTTLLRLILDSHSRIACPPESKFIVQVAKIFEIDQPRNGLLSMGFSETDILKKMRAFVESYFHEYCRRKGKQRWADKTPHHIDHVDTIDQMFEHDPLYVGIVRHGLDVAYSLQDFEWGVLQPYLNRGEPRHVATTRFWQEQNEKLLRIQDELNERFLMLRYEKLTAEPRSTLKALFAFLGEEWEEAVLDYQHQPHDEGYGDTKAIGFDGIVSNSGRYRAWPDAVQQEAYEIATPMFQKLRYAL